MRKFILALVIICSINKIFYGQSEIVSLWFFSDEVALEFCDNGTIESREFSYLENYSLNGDTLTFHHDFENKECWTTDSNGYKIECPDWRTPDSKYLIRNIDLETMVLSPLNTSAKNIVAAIKHPSIIYSLSDFEMGKNQISLETKDGEVFFPPKLDVTEITFYSKESKYKVIPFDDIQISLETQGGYTPKLYIDLRFRYDGKLEYSIVSDESDIEHFLVKLDKEIEKGFFRGQLENYQIDRIHESIRYTNFYEYKENYGGWSSHGTQLRVKITGELGTKVITGYKYKLPILLNEFVEKLLELVYQMPNGVQKLDETLNFEMSYKIK